MNSKSKKEEHTNLNQQDLKYLKNISNYIVKLSSMFGSELTYISGNKAHGSGGLLSFYKTKNEKEIVVKTVRTNIKSIREKQYIDKLNSIPEKNNYILYPVVLERDGFIFVIMEKLDNSLDQPFYNITKNKDKQKIAKQLIEAIEYLHNNNLIHNDIKLENIFFNLKVGRILLADYDCSGGYLNKNKFDRMLCTTQAYLPPDYILNKYTTFNHFKSFDYWQVGLVIYQIYQNKRMTTNDLIEYKKSNPQEFQKELENITKEIGYNISSLLDENKNKRHIVKIE